MNYRNCLFAVASAAFFIANAPAVAQWQIPENSVAIGRGAGTGFKNVPLPSGSLLIGQSGIPLAIIPTGDATISAAGAVAIGATKVTSAMLNADVFSTAHSWAGQQTFVAPILGTPASGVATNLTGTAAGLTAGNVTTNANLTGPVTSVGNATTITANAVTLAKLATQAANTTLSNATSGTAVPTAFAMPSCSTASSALNWTTSTGFGCNSAITASSIAVGGITGLGTGVATALAINVGTAGAPVTNGGALGTPSSGVATNLTGTAASLTAGTVTTNANLTGNVTSVGNATTLAAGSASNLNSGTLLAARMPALTGDCTTSAGAVAVTCTQSAADYKVTGLLQTGGDTRVSTQFDKTNSAVLANVPGLSVTLTAGLTYGFDAKLYVTAGASGGVQAAVGGTATATAFQDAQTIINPSGLSFGQTQTMGAAATGSTGTTNGMIMLEGTITVNAGGTLTAMFAQNASNGTASSVLVGSTMQVWKIN